MWRRRLAALAVAAMVSGPGGVAHAQAYKASPQEQADQKVVRAALEGGFAARQENRPKLETVMAHAPASYPRREVVGDTIVLRQDGGGGGAQALGALMGEVAAQDKGGPKKRAIVVDNTYGLAAMMLGSFAVEDRDFRGAIGWLDKGLALQPDNFLLASEKGQALAAIKRFDDALVAVDSAIAANHDGLDFHGKALITRTRGFVLIELNRLDEAEAAYKEALVLEPDHAGAKGELEYIAKLRRGASPTDYTPALQQGGQAATGAP